MEHMSTRGTIESGIETTKMNFACAATVARDLYVDGRFCGLVETYSTILFVWYTMCGGPTIAVDLRGYPAKWMGASFGLTSETRNETFYCDGLMRTHGVLVATHTEQVNKLQ